MATGTFYINFNFTAIATTAETFDARTKAAANQANTGT